MRELDRAPHIEKSEWLHLENFLENLFFYNKLRKTFGQAICDCQKLMMTINYAQLKNYSDYYRCYYLDLNYKTYVSLPSPQMAILLLSSVHAISLIAPPKEWYLYFKICSLLVVSQILVLPDASKTKHQTLPDKNIRLFVFLSWSRSVYNCKTQVLTFHL